MPFLNELDVRVISKGRVQLLADFSYRIPNTADIIIVPKGFMSDFASIPRGFRWLITGAGKTRKPAIIHDWLYSQGIGTRKRADEVFRTAMKESGMGWKRHVAYRAVRMGGMFAWQG